MPLGNSLLLSLIIAQQCERVTRNARNCTFLTASKAFTEKYLDQKKTRLRKNLEENFHFSLGNFYNCSRIYYDCRRNHEMELKEAQWQMVNALWQKHSATARNTMDRLPRRESVGPRQR